MFDKFSNTSVPSVQKQRLPADMMIVLSPNLQADLHHMMASSHVCAGAQARTEGASDLESGNGQDNCQMTSQPKTSFHDAALLTCTLLDGDDVSSSVRLLQLLPEIEQ